MAWIKIDQTLRDHRKICDAADALEISPTLMTGMMVLFWLWALDNAPSGDVSSISNSTIARAAQWTGDPDRFVQALKEQDLIDETPDGDLDIHDWYEYAGKLIDRRKADADRARKKRAASSKESEKRPRDVQRTSADRVRVEQSRVDNTSPKGDDKEPPAETQTPKQAPVPYEKIRELFNTTCPSYSKVVGIKGKRKTNVGARWGEHPDLGFFAAYFSRIEASAFLKGDNDRKWKATFDWLTNAANMDKVLEGRYDGGGDDHGNGTDRRDPEQNARDYTKGFKTDDE